METYEPWVESPTAAPHATVLPMTDDEKAEVAKRPKRPFGFARALAEPEPWKVTVLLNGEPIGTWDDKPRVVTGTLRTLKSSTCTDSHGVIREVVPREVMKLRKGESIVITRVSDNDDALSVQVRHAAS